MQAGRMDKRVDLQSATSSQDATGQPIRTWATYATVWAAVEPLKGRELMYARQAGYEAEVRVTIWYRSDLDPKHRVVVNGTAYEITSVIDPEMGHVTLELMCKATS